MSTDHKPIELLPPCEEADDADPAPAETIARCVMWVLLTLIAGGTYAYTYSASRCLEAHLRTGVMVEWSPLGCRVATPAAPPAGPTREVLT